MCTCFSYKSTLYICGYNCITPYQEKRIKNRHYFLECLKNKKALFSITLD